ncbi:hypothetical protein GOP47_0013503 [Adiantum capillus-veneris]|uniref:anthranilate synthase n=1 Tax=Adiantum capillus-veneris TaxID=13818 RepID=A0A9D4UP61_ADICA|nr:hypothetical protein GOP47_0013503 [Adiantum capillus-veneris]
MAATASAGVALPARHRHCSPSCSREFTENSYFLRFTASSVNPQPIFTAPSQGSQVSRCSIITTRVVNVESAALQTTQDFKLEKPVIVIDNYDSFTYNLVQYLGSLGCPMEVYRNDELTVEELKMKEPSGILISPGPGTPQDSGISLETVIKLSPHIPLFGVCMGLQCMGEAFGGKIVRSPLGVMHGKKSLVYYDEHGEDGLLAGLPNPFVAGRYHSLVIDKETFPSQELEVTAWTEDGLVMGVRHKKYRHVQVTLAF